MFNSMHPTVHEACPYFVTSEVVMTLGETSRNPRELVCSGDGNKKQNVTGKEHPVPKCLFHDQRDWIIVRLHIVYSFLFML